jgi:hydrogenase nickel incorporation protein HypB
MCEECGCSQDEHENNKNHNQNNNLNDHEKSIQLDKSVNEVNDKLAHDLWHSLQDKEIFCVNILGSPGSGKTTFIENIADFLGKENIAVIQGDLESDVDKKRLEEKEISCYQINTHSGCHLNAMMINKAVIDLAMTEKLKGKMFLFIENVGNLVCPAGVKIGQHMDLVVSSTTEGSDKPKKYPIIFLDAKLVVISKYDLKDAVNFVEEKYLEDIKNINSKAKIIKVSNKDNNNEGFKEAAHFIEHEREHLLEIKHEH